MNSALDISVDILILITLERCPDAQLHSLMQPPITAFIILGTL